jgi:hypothetical protein
MRPAWLSFVTAGIVLAPHAAAAQDWRRPDTDGKYYWVLVDAKSVQRDASKGWMRFTYAHAGGPNYRSLTPLGTSRVQAAFDCKSGQFHSFRDNKWQPASKGHFEGPVRDFVCKR